MQRSSELFGGARRSSEELGGLQRSSCLLMVTLEEVLQCHRQTADRQTAGRQTDNMDRTPADAPCDRHRKCTESADSSFPSRNWGNPPASLRHFSEPRSLLVADPSSVMTRSTKMSATMKIYFSLSLYHVGHSNVDFKCSYTLDYIDILFRHHFMHRTVSPRVKYNV